MSIYVMRTLAAGDISWSLCSRWQNQPGKLQKVGLQLPHSLRNSLKTSNLNHSRWPGRRNLVNTVESQSDDIYSLNRLWKPFAFTVAVSGTSLAGAAIWQYENIRSQALLTKKRWGGFQTPKYGQFRQHINNWWNGLSASNKVFAPICTANVLVYLAWWIPAWQPMMKQYFTAGLATRALCLPMLLSVFSHFSGFHLAANMFVLHSFADKAVSSLGKEQFVAVYLTGGMISSFTSYLFKALIRSPTGSLGASGAVMCVLGYVCSKYPHSQLAVILLPQYPFEAGMGLKALLCLDTVGCILRWSFFDHAAHLGGSLCGICWHYWGYEYIWKKRGSLVSAWHNIRGPVQ